MSCLSKATTLVGLGRKDCPTAPPTLLWVRAGSPHPAAARGCQPCSGRANRSSHRLPPPPSPRDTHSPFPAGCGTRECRRVPPGAGPGSARSTPGRGARCPLPVLTCTPRWARRGSSPGSSASRKAEAATPPGALARLSSAEILARCVLRSSVRRTSSSTRSALRPAAARQRSRRRHGSPAMAAHCAGREQDGGARSVRTRHKMAAPAGGGGSRWRRPAALEARPLSSATSPEPEERQWAGSSSVPGMISASRNSGASWRFCVFLRGGGPAPLLISQAWAGLGAGQAPACLALLAFPSSFSSRKRAKEQL